MATPVFVKVTNPEKTDEGTFKSYIDYTVVSTVTRSFGNNWVKGSFTVQRRYRDFAWLDGVLGDNFVGVIRPPLPSNSQAWSLLGNDDANVEERRRHLEEYASRLMTHPELSFDHSVYIFFCCADNASFTKFRTEAAALAAASRVEALPDAVGNVGPMMEANLLSTLVKSTLDSKLVQENQSLHESKTKLEESVKNFEATTSKQRALGAQYFHSGLSYNMLAKTEQKLALSDSLRVMGRAYDELSLIVSTAADADEQEVIYPLQEQIRFISSVISVLDHRSECRVAAASAADDWKLKNAKAEEKHNELIKLQEQNQKDSTISNNNSVGNHNITDNDLKEGDHNKTGSVGGGMNLLPSSNDAEKILAKLVNADETARATAEISVRKAMATRKRLDDFDQRLCKELDRFRCSHASEVRAAMLAYAQHREEYACKAESIWAGVLPHIEEAHLSLDPFTAQAAYKEAMMKLEKNETSSHQDEKNEEPTRGRRGRGKSRTPKVTIDESVGGGQGASV